MYNNIQIADEHYNWNTSFRKKHSSLVSCSVFYSYSSLSPVIKDWLEVVRLTVSNGPQFAV